MAVRSWRRCTCPLRWRSQNVLNKTRVQEGAGVAETKLPQKSKRGEDERITRTGKRTGRKDIGEERNMKEGV